MIHERGFDDTFYYFGYEKKIRDWPVVGVFLFIQSEFLKQWRDDRLSEGGMKLAGNERLTILVIVETSTDEHSLRSQVGMDI